MKKMVDLIGQELAEAENGGPDRTGTGGSL